MISPIFRCMCRQPYDDRFMIGCDCCEEWFHGKCVNVTKVQGKFREFPCCRIHQVFAFLQAVRWRN